MADDAHAPDQTWCNRTDGKRWRFKHPAMPGKLLCYSHFHKLPSSNSKPPPKSNIPPLPPESSSASDQDDSDSEIRVPGGRGHLDRQKKRKRSWALEMEDAYSIVDDDDIKPNPSGASSSSGTKIRRRRKKMKVTETAEEDHNDDDQENKSKEKKLINIVEAMEEEDMAMETGEEGQNEEDQENKGKVEENKEKKKRRRRKNKENVEEKDVEKKTRKRRKKKNVSPEITRELPNGVMAISPPGPDSVNEAPPPVKLGVSPPTGRLVDRRCRTKNVNRPPVSTVKVVPYAKIMRDKAGSPGGTRKCHWCQRNCDGNLINCISCKKSSFCSDCIQGRCIDAKEIEKRCIVCRGTCECISCLTSRAKDATSKENSKKQSEASEHSLQYLIHLVLPILEQINEEQKMELEMEAKFKGQSLSEVEAQQVEVSGKNKISCNKCSTFILDMHRSCPSCSYSLCLSCCQESRSLAVGNTAKKQAKKSMQSAANLDNEGVCCPSSELGGCDTSILDLRCVFPVSYTTELEKSAKEIILSKDSPQNLDASLHCSMCTAMAKEGGNKRELVEASRRKHPGDNFLFSPSIRDDYETLILHFQKHWRNSHPVVVRDLLEKASNISWDPIALFSNYLKMFLSGSENDKEETGDPNCTDLYKVEFSSKDSYSGPALETVHSSCETLKLKAKLSSALSKRVFADLYAEIIDDLPIQQYTNPGSGFLNLAVKSAEDSRVSEFSPHVIFTCGSAEEIRRGELVSELRYSSHDLVNVLVHASDFPWSSDQVNNMKSLMRMNTAKEQSGITKGGGEPNRHGGVECDSLVICSSNPEKSNGERASGVQWDVFRRQDAPKLVGYIQKHFDVVYDPYGSSEVQVTDPNLDGSFFLDSTHKMQLKNEFKIEPWTFTQKLGEAVIIPAGCPYQTRSLKSCMNVVVGFISPENAGESIKLMDKCEASKVEVQKMAISKISNAIEQLRRKTGK